MRWQRFITIPSLQSLAIRILLLVAAILITYWIACALLYGAPPRPKVSCLAENQPVTVSERQPDGSYKEHDEEDWHVTCEITDGNKKLYPATALPHTGLTSFRDAMLSIEEWRLKKAPVILKELKSKEKS